MSRKVRLIVECEDALHRSFATSFFQRVGVPSGKSPEIEVRDGKEGVLSILPARIRTIRRASPETHLVVLVDGDNWDATHLRKQIDSRLVAMGEPPITQEDRVFIVVPRWQMDTWVRHLRGEAVTEDQNGAAKLDADREARGPAQDLAKRCRNHRPLKDSLPSLDATCREWQAYRERHDL